MCCSMIRLVFFALILNLFHSASARGGDGFGDGETFIYQASWGVFSDAGRVVIVSEQEESGGANRMRITMDVESQGIVHHFYPLDTRSVVIQEMGSGRILRLREAGYDGRKGVDRDAVFDYAERRVDVIDRVRPDRNRTIELPDDEDPIDLIVSLIKARGWNLQLGEERELLVYASRDIYPLLIKAEAYEEVHTPLGSFQTLLLVPRMRGGEPRGVFKDGDEIKVWIGGENEPLPVKMQLRLSYGVASLTLISHDPGRRIGGE